MNQNLFLAGHALLCDRPASNTAVAAMANLQSAKNIDLAKAPPLHGTPERWQTDEGAQVSFIAMHDRPMFDLVLRFRAGSVLDGTSPGLAALAMYSLDQGTEQHDAAQFAQQMAGCGAILSRKISDDSATITLRCLSLPTLRTSVMRLFTAMLARPAFRAAEVAKIRERIKSYRARRGADPVMQMAEAIRAHAFNGHPYAASSATDAIDSISLEQLRAFHKQAYSANNLDIGLVGNLTREQAEQLITDLVQALPQRWAAQGLAPVARHQPLARHLKATHSNTQAILAVVSAVSPRDPVFPALMLLNMILGGSYESRLTQELRNRRSLTYAIESNLRPLDAASVLYIHWDIAPQYRDASHALVSAILACLRENGPGQEECDMAVNQIANELHHDFADNAKLAAALATHSHQGLPADHLASFIDKLSALTPSDLREVAQVWLSQPEILVTTGPETEQLPLPEPLPTDQ
ncbi:M16 family metallopeptidase [Pseudomonas sp. NPDC090592]|uniref:M16 family metallopeptidase n=1 Tax=Pseudomonas sp. NPDC090592 TaxID=3364480 RepID=UPI00383AC05A